MELYDLLLFSIFVYILLHFDFFFTVQYALTN